MKIQLYALLFSIFVCGCQDKQLTKTLITREISGNEDFNNYADKPENILTVVKSVDNGNTGKNADAGELFTVKFRDTVLQIQPDTKDKDFVKDKFSLAEFVNTQKTALLVQLADETGLVAPFYLITLKGNKPEAVSLYRASKGNNDINVTKGMIRVGKSGYLINNDYFVTTVNAKVYVIPRQNQEERIQGQFFLKSDDKNTFVFLVPGAFYEVHYPTGDVFTQPLPKQAPKEISSVYKWVQDNFAWEKNGKGISFFKEVDQNKVVDMRRGY
jgi:hypothetical protein